MKKFFKIIGWTTATILFLILAVVLLINVPSVQNYIIDKITFSVSSKTNSTITIGRVGISFPKSLFLKNVYLDDLNKDTLLYAGEIKADVDMIALFKGDIVINKISLDEIKATIHRSSNDSLYNFSFLLNAFSSNDSSKTVSEKKDSSGFMIHSVELTNIHLLFNDLYAGIYAKTDFEKLEIETEKMDITNLEFLISSINFSNAKVSLSILKNDTTSKPASNSSMPEITVSRMDFRNIDLNYINIPDSQLVSLLTDHLEMKNGIYSGKKNHVSVDNFESLNTSVVFRNKKNEKATDTTFKSSNPVEVLLKDVSLQNTNLSYDAGTAKQKNGFDPDHIHIKGLNLIASNSMYSESASHTEIHNFSFSLSEGFELKKFKADVHFTTNELKVENLNAITNHSHINATVSCTYVSLEALQTFARNVVVKAEVSNTVIAPRDITWFAPQLAAQPFLSNTSPPITIDGNINGIAGDLLIKNLTVSAGQTTVNASGRITGLPEINKTFFAINSFHVRTVSADVYGNLPAGTIPANIQLPGQLSLSGSFKGTIKVFDADVALNSSFGNIDANVKSGAGESYEGEIVVDELDAGKLLRDEKQFGTVSLEAKVKGKGYSKETADADLDLIVSAAEINGYEYQNLEMKGRFANQQFDGDIKMDDPNLVFDFTGMAGFKKGEETYKFALNLEGANLQKLNFSKDDLRLAAHAELDMKGNTIDNLNGRAGITNIILIKENKSYSLDSLLFASVNENGNSELSLSSSIVSASFKGSIAPGKLASEIVNHINRYFPVNDSLREKASSEKNNFTFEIKFHNHPVITDVFLPKLKDFDPGIIEGKFNGAENIMELNASLTRLDYDGTELRDATLHVISDSSVIKASLKIGELTTASQQVTQIELTAEAKNNSAALNFTANETGTEKRLALSAVIKSPSKNVYEVVLANGLEFGGGTWNVSADNKLILDGKKPPVINLSLTRDNEQLSVRTKDSASIEMQFKDFELLSVSNMIKKDTAIAEGKLNGTFTLLGNGGFNSQASLTDLKIRTHPVGNLEVIARNSSSGNITLDILLQGNGNNLSLKGAITPNQDASSLDIPVDITSIDMRTVDAFSFGQLTNSTGNISGKLHLTGTFTKPQLNGKINFENVATTPTALNTQLLLKNETVEISNSEFKLTDFKVLDKNNRMLELNGTVSLEDLTDPRFSLLVETDNFLVMNSDEKAGNYFGTVYLDSKIKLEGALSALKVNADLKLDEGSNLGIAIPESQLTVDRGENVVVFTNTSLNPVMTRNTKKDSRKSDYRNLNIIADIQIDKNATLKIVVDQSTGDSLVVKGDAALSFTMDAGGQMSLTGTYEVDEGSYLVTLQDLIKRQFKIQKGSTIRWNGDPLDADIDMNAIYTVRTSPIDLVVNQVSDLASAEQNQFKQRLPFEVVLKLKGQLLTPEIAFEILLPPEHRGAMNGVVAARLAQLNEDESELNKQVFALLVLGRFIQEDPLASESGNGAEGIARQSVSRFLTQQLNQWSAQNISGIELDFDVQSYDDYSTGQSQGRTELGVGLRKQFNDRLSVQVGGSLNLEGQGTGQNNYGDMAGDILIEYKLTQDGRYKLKGFRQNQFEEVFEGQIMETGAAIVYTRDFDKWRDLFRKVRREENEEAKNIKSEAR